MIMNNQSCYTFVSGHEWMVFTSISYLTNWEKISYLIYTKMYISLYSMNHGYVNVKNIHV